MNVPPVRTAMSPSIALRRSPKPGALTAQTLSTPRSLLTTSAASASPSTSSAMISSGSASAPPSRAAAQLAEVGDLLLVDQDQASSSTAFSFVAFGDEVGRDVALVELHALDELEVVSSLLPSSTVMTPSLPTFSTLGHQVADLGVVVGRDRGDLGDLCRCSRTGFASAFERPRRRPRRPCRCRA